MKNAQVMLAVATVFSLFAAMAADVVFPTPASGTIGDLASAASWGLEKIPDATNRIVFASTLTATASNDINYAGIYVNKQNATVTLDMRDETTAGSPRKIDLTGHISNTGSKGQTLNIRGGHWDLHGKQISMRGGWGANANNVIEISDGAVIDNAGKIQGSYGSSGQKIIVRGTGTVVRATHFKPVGFCGSSCTAYVQAGAVVAVTNTTDEAGNGDGAPFGTDPANEGSAANSGYVVEGAGSLLDVWSTKSTYTVGNSSRNAFLKVIDGGTARIRGSSCYVANATKGGASSALIYVANGGNLTIGGTIYFGQKGLGRNTLLIGEGGTFTGVPSLGGISNSGTPDNGLIVSNGTYASASLPEVARGGSGASNCYVRLIGPRMKFNVGGTGNANLFSNGARAGRYEILAGAAWTNTTYKAFMMGCNGSKGRHVFLVDNAEFYTTKPFYLADIDYTSISNVVRVQNGAKFHVGGLISYSFGNGISVSNATIEAVNVSVNGKSNSPQMGAQSNNWFMVEGDSPRVICGNSFSAPQASYVKFAIPANGYQPGIVPITVATNFTVSADSHLLAEGLEERLANIEATERITLATAGNKMTVPQAVLDEANALLPEKCKFYVEGKNLMLKAWKPSGLTLIVR